MAVKNNQNAVKHGGRAAIERLKDGKPFTGLAKAAQDDVLSRLDLDGPEGELTRDAVRLQAASDMYWPVFVKMIEEGNHEKATEYLAKLGWLTNSAIRAWQAVVKVKPPEDTEGITEILATYRTPSTSPLEGENDPNN